MASLFLRDQTWWIDYTVDGRRTRRSLDTSNERVARDRLRTLTAKQQLGQLDARSSTDLVMLLESFAAHGRAGGGTGHHGNSGGPMLDRSGRWVGLITLGSTLETGANFALRSDELQQEFSQWLTVKTD